MKKILMAAVAITAISATPAMAANVTQAFQVTGIVSGSCNTMTGGTAAFGTITPDAATGFVTSGTASTVTQNVFCNAAGSTISYASTGTLTNLASAPNASFTNTLSYAPAVTLDGTAVPAGGSLPVSSGSLVVGAGSLSSSSKIAVSGSYAGSITVTLTPGA